MTLACIRTGCVVQVKTEIGLVKALLIFPARLIARWKCRKTHWKTATFTLLQAFSKISYFQLYDFQFIKFILFWLFSFSYFHVSLFSVSLFLIISRRMVFLITNTLRGYESLFSLKEKMNFELNIYITKKKRKEERHPETKPLPRWRRLRWRCSHLGASNLPSTYIYYLLEKAVYIKWS